MLVGILVFVGVLLAVFVLLAVGVQVASVGALMSACVDVCVCVW